MIARRVLSLALLCLALSPAAARAGFEFLPGSLAMSAENSDGTLTTQASSHPYAFTAHFALKTTAGGQTEGGSMRNLIIDLPPGMVANPQAVFDCSRQDFEAQTCDPSTQVGVFQTILPGVGEANGPLYNLTPPPGVAAQVGFSSLGFTLLGSAGVRTEEGYGARVTANNLPLESSSGTFTIWGTPADKRHDPERGSAEQGTLGSSSEGPLLPFFTLPSSCLAPPLLTLRAESKLGDLAAETAPMRDQGANPVALSGCDAVPFAPNVLSLPGSAIAESPSGLDFQLGLPGKGLLNPNEGAVSETEPETMVISLPAGVTANPAAANGQGVCTPAQYRAASAVSGPGQGCPQSAKIGTLSASTPLLEEAIEGSVYLAAPHENPFGSLLALYIVAAVPERGVLVKQAGEVSLDPLTGQLDDHRQRSAAAALLLHRPAPARRPAGAADHPPALWHLHHHRLALPLLRSRIPGGAEHPVHDQRRRRRSPLRPQRSRAAQLPDPLGREHAHQRRLLQPLPLQALPRRRHPALRRRHRRTAAGADRQARRGSRLL